MATTGGDSVDDDTCQGDACVAPTVPDTPPDPQNPTCTVNVAVGSSIDGISPSLPQVEDNVNQYFQSQAGISVNFVSGGDPSATATLNFVNNGDAPPGMTPANPGWTFIPYGGGWPVVFVNTSFFASVLDYGPNGSYFQGVVSVTEHELVHALTNGQVGNSDSGLMGSFDVDTDFTPPTPNLSPNEIQQLQEDNCQQGDFGGNRGPLDPGSPDQPAVARRGRHF
jgi:hypothetical protein